MKKYYFIITFLCAIPLIPVARAQEEQVVITIDTLSHDVYMLTGQGGNIGIYVGKKYVFMIDDQFERISTEIREAIGKLSDKPLAFLFNTHMHGDHTGGNVHFNSDQTTLVAHDRVRERLDEQKKADLEAEKIDRATYERILPEVTFSNDITFHDGEETIMAFHVHNAHTDGDSEIYFTNNNVIHMGDTYFAGRYPYIDLNSGGSIDGYINAQKQVLMLIDDDTAIIPGHGRPSNKAELKTYIAMLEDIRAKVQAAIDSGKSLEQVKAMAELTAAYDAIHGTGFIGPEQIRETFYNSLNQN